jgi:3',5'-cyclic AMP phosphodiesterase CpdA
MKIAHLTDLHIDSPKALRPGMLFTGWHPNRRVFGAANFLLARKSIHQVPVLKAAVDAVRLAGADHCVITGDVSNLAIEDEFVFVRGILDPIGGPDRLSIVPGNHDWYTPESVSAGLFEKHFGDLIWAPDVAPGTWPTFKDFDGVRLILARTAWTPPPGMAWGKMGTEQIEAVFRLAEDAADRGLFVVLAQHHHLHRRHSATQRFTGRFIDAAEELEMIARSRIGLVIHGHDHNHHDQVVPSKHASGGTRIVCGGSATYLDEHHGRFGRMAVYDIRGGRLQVEKWQYRLDLERFAPCPAE